MIDRATMRAVRYYSRHIGPMTIGDSGVEAVPGDIWYVEEDAWYGAWRRRGNSDFFDAIMTKSGAVVTFTIELRRTGDMVIGHRTNASDGSPPISYSGKMEGRRVRGTYPGGRWFAIIQRAPLADESRENALP